MWYRQFLLSVAGGALGAFLFSLLPLARRPAAPPPAIPERREGVVTASELRLVDPKGRLRAQLAFAGEGPPGFWLYDENGVVRFTFGLYPDQTPFLGLQDAQGRMIELMRTFGTKGSPLLIFKHEGQDKMITGLNPGNSPEPFLVTQEPGGRKTHFGIYEGP